MVDWISLEEIWRIHLEAITSEVVNNKLIRSDRRISELEEDAKTRLAHAVIIEFEAEDIRQVKDDLVFRIVCLGCRDVGLYAVDFLIRPLINKRS